MSSSDHELYRAASSNNLKYLSSMLFKTNTRKNSNLGRREWKSPLAPLHISAYAGRDNMVAILVAAGVDINSFALSSSGMDRYTAMHWAVYSNRPSTVSLLLELGADTELEGKLGRLEGTAMQWAKMLGKRENICRIIAEHNSASRDNNEATSFLAALKASGSDLEHVDSLVKTFNRLAAMTIAKKENEDEAKNCPICFFIPPAKVFTCIQCSNWMCEKCMEPLSQCAFCRTDFGESPPKRCLEVERLLARI